MARARNIKPGFFESEQVGSVSISARLLFISLWQLADREGRLLDRPMQIKAFAFRYDAIGADAVDGWLAELDASGLVCRYQIDGQKLIEIPNFVKHQKPHPREEPSALPSYFYQKPRLGTANTPWNHINEHLGAADASCMGGQPRLGTAEGPWNALHENLGTADGPYMATEPRLGTAFSHETPLHEAKGSPKQAWGRGSSPLNVECGMLNVESGKRNEEGGERNTGLTPAPPPPAQQPLLLEANAPDPDELFQKAAKFACEQLPAGGDIGLTVSAMRTEFQKSASFDGNPAGFCLAYTASVRKWRAAYDNNPDLRTKAAQWWTRDGVYAQSPPAPRAPRRFGPVDLKAGLEVEDAL